MPGPAQREKARGRALLAEYEAWLQRVDMTRESVQYCCFHRLGRDPVTAERVSVEVIAGLLARPKVFQYFGLPFSGRVAHLAEMGIARAREGALSGDGDWQTLRDELIALPEEEQEVVVLACVEGLDDAGVASALGCDETTAQRRREAAFNRLRALVGDVLGEGAERPTKPSRGERRHDPPRRRR